MENYSNVSTEELIRMASKKDADAQVVLAYRFADDSYKEKNIPAAVEWGEKAFAKGKREVAPLLAKLYFYGDSNLHDTEKAFNYYSVGASLNDVECLCQLANEFYSGKNGVEQNNQMMYSCIAKALTLCGNDIALQGKVMYFMGNMYFYGFGVKRNIEEAVNYYLKSAALGNSNAYIALTMCYKEKNIPQKVRIYAEKACDCGDDATIEDAINAYNYATEQLSKNINCKTCKLSDVANACDRHIHDTIRKLNEGIAGYKKFDSEADRLIKNAQTFDKIGNYKKVYPTYERVADEYPHDFRGWYNMARVFTNNFAVYSIFSADGYGKLERSEYFENMLYAQRTVEACFENDLLKICDDYKNGCVDISIEELKNTLYTIYHAEDTAEKAAEYARKYEEKITYLYKNKPCNVTALALHVLMNVLNNDNIKKYNAKVKQHNASVDEKVEIKVNDYIIELAQKMKIENPRDYASNAQALQDIETDEDIQAQIAKYRNEQKASMEYYSEIENMAVCDVYDETTFGNDRPYMNYRPQNEYEYDDDFVDFAVAFAEKCSIQMRGYDAFYSPKRKKEYYEYIKSENAYDMLRLDYFNKFLLLKQKYTDMMPHKSRAFDELTEIVSEYIEIYSEYERTNSSGVLKQVFKGKELKEDKEDVKSAFDAVCVRMDGIMNKILANARSDINSLNAEYARICLNGDSNGIAYDESVFDDIIYKKFEKIKSNKV